jgi:hypothetical protein
VAEQTKTLMFAATANAVRPPQRLVGAFLDDDLDRRLAALYPARSLAATAEFPALVDGLIAALNFLNPTLARRALIALASLGPPAVPRLLDHLDAGLSTRAHRALVTALAVAAHNADPETREEVRAALSRGVCDENPPYTLWFACRAALAWMDDQENVTAAVNIGPARVSW